MKDMFTIVKIEVVPSSVAPKEFELKIYHADGTWQYFSRGFGSRQAALETAKKISKNVK